MPMLRRKVLTGPFGISICFHIVVMAMDDVM